MLKTLLASLVLLPGLLWGQVDSHNDFSGGLNTRNAGVLLKDNESPDLLNVVVDENGGVSRRKGSIKVNSTAIGDGSSDANAAYGLEQSGGTKYCLSFSSTTGYYSTDGCVSNTVFISTLTRGNDVNCVSYSDKSYCVNNQYNFAVVPPYHTLVASAPSDLDVIYLYNNRCFGAGKDTNPSRLYWSNLGTCETWSTSTDFVDLDAEDGDRIVGISSNLGFLTVCKNYSSYIIAFDNANSGNRRVITVSKTIGCRNHRAIRTFNNRQYFLSSGPNGGQPGVYSSDNIKIDEDTPQLRGSIDQLANFNGNTGRKTVDSKPDWDNATFDPYALSSSRDAGFMQSSYTARGDTTSTDWSRGTLVNVSTVDVSGSITLSSGAIRDNFNTGSYANPPSSWTLTAGLYTLLQDGRYWIYSDSDGLLASKINTAVVQSSGSWSFVWKNTVPGNLDNTCGAGFDQCFSFNYFSKDANNFYALEVWDGANTSLRLTKTVSGTRTVLASVAQTFAANTQYAFEIVRSSVGVSYVYLDGVFKASTTADSSITGTNKVEIQASGQTSPAASTVRNFFANIYIYGYPPIGTYTSSIWDTYISTPVGGPFSATATLNSQQYQVNFYVRQSTSPNNDMWNSWHAASDTVRVSMGLRYQQYKADLYTFISTRTPRVDAVGLTAASTGTWRSNELFLSNAMTSWGLFQADRTVTGIGASISYGLKISTYAGGTASTGTLSVTPGNSIAHTTGAYVVVIATYTVFSASETAKDDVLVINYNEGTGAKSATMEIFKGRLHVCGQSPAGLINDTCYVRDARGSWVRWTGINARHLNVIGQKFLAAGSSTTSGGFIYQLYNSDSDAGQPIHSYWSSRDYALSKLENLKAIDRVYVLGSNDATSLTATLGADSGVRTSTFTVNLSTGAAYKITNVPVPKLPVLNGNTFRIKFENNAASKPWSIFGFGLLFRDNGLMNP